MNLHIERRKRFRKRPPRLVYVELGSGNGGMLRDLSEDGFALRAMMPLATGEQMHFCLSLEDATRIEGESQVIWTGEGGRAAGLKFVEITTESREKIREWLGRLDEFPKPEEKTTSPATHREALVEQLKREVRNVPPRPISLQEETRVSVITPEPDWKETPPSHLKEDHQEKIPPLPISPREPYVPRPTVVFEPPPPVAQPPHASVLPAPSAEATTWQKHSAAQVVLPPLPALEDETEGGELAAARAVRHSIFSRTAAIILFLAAAGAATVYHQELGYGLIWLGQQLVGEPPAPTPQPEDSRVPSSSTVPSDSSPTPVESSDLSKPSVNPTKDQPPTRAQAAPVSDAPVTDQLSPARQSSTDLPSPRKASETTTVLGEPPADTGQAEYGEASRILASDDNSSALPEAVRLLWVAVEKGNSGAEVALAELYRSGRGVKKNCDQARVLLSAAARKGNSQAQKNLQDFLREGCQSE